jgi:hypothetical protein
MERAFTLRKRALQLIAECQYEQANVVLTQAIEASYQLEHAWQRAESLCCIARLLARSGEREHALALLSQAIQ